MNNQVTQVGALSRVDAAQYVGISVRYLDSIVAQGKLRKVKVGRKTLFRIVDLDKFLEDNLCSN